MGDLDTAFAEWFDPDKLLSGVRAVVLLAVGLLIARVMSRSLWRLLGARLDLQQGILLRRASFYLLFGLFVLSALREVGFDVGVLLGAAGVLSVAIGFASQTSASNVISGLFLVFERPFHIGDIIQVGETTGEVLSIDLLSVKLRTFDNRFVRIPNETMIKTEVTTMTRFPIRRVDIEFGVGYGEDLAKVQQILFALASRNPLCLEDPKPLFAFQGFGSSALELLFAPWVRTENYLEVKSGMQDEIKRAFAAEGVEIPFPHLTLVQPAASGREARGAERDAPPKRERSSA